MTTPTIIENQTRQKDIYDVSVLNEENLEKLIALNNEHVLNIVYQYISLLKPSEVYVITNSDDDVNFVREMAIKENEESKLKMKGHTIHYDSYFDQARDKNNTKILVTAETPMSKRLNTIDRDEGLKEIFDLMDGIMKGKQMIIRFFVLGPKNSQFSICALQITDSWYVAHSEDLLYRRGYTQFKLLNGSDNFFLLVHSAGELNGTVTKNIDKRRIYIDPLGNRVLSCNNQYAGNSLGLKKLALRLAIYKSNQEDWLTEHYFIMGVENEEKKRKTYFSGAYPSACGKTSTAMIPSSNGYKFTIVGDDIVYIRNINGSCRAVNIEKGIFGILQDVNPKDDPLIYKALTTPREVIFSNVLINDKIPYWLGMGKELPDKGMNHSGEGWYEGKKDAKRDEILPAHPNARFTLKISALENADPNYDDPEGVEINGIFYGGRDSDTNVPVYESLSWKHGVFVGATIESETTSATLGAVGVRSNSPMANMDFLVVPLGLYFNNHKKFGEKLGRNAPKVFKTNYFLKLNGEYANDKLDKKIWVLWAECRIHGEYNAIRTPFGFIPMYEDLKELFRKVFDKEYTKEEYEIQFSIRILKLLEKLDRMEKLFKEEPNIPKFFWEILEIQRKELIEMQKKYGSNIVSPFKL
ncbi:MAG: phosphoenolpyruvate carboxykinase (GTP) [Candidatus Lokiarchaeota archaeon]|nr:phosphoenolpyruvate carboxykinase (GTP) [Candidatus Lokiarchaeota archaeon]